MVSSIGIVIVNYRNPATQDNYNTETRTYGDEDYLFELKQDQANQGYYYQVSSKDTSFVTYLLPEQIDIEIDENTMQLLRNSYFFYLTFDPEQENLVFFDVLRFDLRNNIPSSRFIVDSIITESTAYDLPVISCGNATLETPVIYTRNANTTSIETKNNCVMIEFEDHQFGEVRDTLVYSFNNIELG
jgi:hypothetical protein